MAKKSKGRKAPVKKPLEVNVDVYAYREGDDVLFAHAWNLEGGQVRNKGRIKIGAGQGDVPINFVLHDNTKLGLAYLDVDDDGVEGPFWCSQYACPIKWGNGGGQIISIEKLSDTKLKVVDANKGGPRTLHYVLRFNGKAVGSGPPYEYDPDIRNGGGGVSSGGS